MVKMLVITMTSNRFFIEVSFWLINDQMFYERENHEVTRKMAKGHRTDWKIFD